jgi:hypothetical protein
MKHTAQGSADGRRVTVFEAGQTYEIPSVLARAFEIMGVIESGHKPAETQAAQDVETPEAPRRGRPRKAADVAAD